MFLATLLRCRYFFRYVVLLSYIIPISLRVNLDMAKTMSPDFFELALSEDTRSMFGESLRFTSSTSVKN